jgi:hypothetical protein
VTSAPSIVRWTDHALTKADFLDIARANVEDAVLDHFAARMRNGGAGDWKLVRDRMVVIFNHPDEGEDIAARVVTLWRQR